MILYNRSSHYHNIRVRQEGSCRYLDFLNNQGSTCLTQGGVDLLNPYRHVLNFTRYFSYGLFYKGFLDNLPNRVLIIGLGGGIFPRVLKNLLPTVEIDIIELDPVVLDIARRYFLFNDVDGIVVHIGDAWRLVGNLSGKYDWILMDAWDSSSVIYPLLTDNFNSVLRNYLVDGGLYSVNLMRDHVYWASHVRTLAESYGWDIGVSDDIGTNLRNHVLHFGKFDCGFVDMLGIDSNIYSANVLRLPDGVL